MGNSYYVAGPPIRLGRFITNEKFSRDGEYISYIDEQLEGSYPTERAKAISGTEDDSRALLRLNLRKGTKETLYLPKSNEVVMSIEPVGSGGDIICTVAQGPPIGDNLKWKALYCPIGGTARIIADDVVTRSFQVAASKTERKAFLLVCGLDAPASYFFITSDQTVTKSLPNTGFQGGFFSKTASGNPVAVLQGPAPDYKLVGNFELSFATGAARAIPNLFEAAQEEPETHLIDFDLIDRSRGDEEMGQAPLKDIFARPGEKKNGSQRFLVAQGVIALLSEAPNGLAFAYMSTEGYFVREMLKVDAKFADRLKKGG